MPYAQTNGITMYYEAHGEGPPLLLIGGLGSDGHLWYKQAPVLAVRFQVITPDNRGAGRTDAPDEPYAIRTMADDLAGLLDRVHISAAHVVGASMGGAIAQEFALAYPYHVRKLILCCTAFGGPHSVPIPQDTVALLQSRTGDPTHDLRGFLRVQFGTDYPQVHAQELDEYMAWRVAHPQPLPAFQRQLAATADHDTESRLGQLRMPVLILHGGQDRVVPVGNAHLMAARIPGARVHVFPDAGHLFLWEYADEANRMLVEFLNA
jgi:3-oxoadipate enol-lactonase